MVYKIEISSSDIKHIEENLRRKDLQLNEISYSINGFAIANVSRINPDEDTDDFEPSYYTVIIDVKKKTCCKFDFYGHKTNGTKILAKPKIGKHFIFYPYFDIDFMERIRYNICTRSLWLWVLSPLLCRFGRWLLQGAFLMQY